MRGIERERSTFKTIFPHSPCPRWGEELKELRDKRAEPRRREKERERERERRTRGRTGEKKTRRRK